MAFSKIILNNQTLMDVTTDTVEASKLLSGETATAASGQKVTGTLVQSNDFVITLTKNQSDDWEPDCTFAEAVSAYNAGKNIAAKASTGDSAAVQIRTQDQTTQCFFYIEEYFTSGGESGFNDLFYQWTETGMERQDSAKLYFTENADAVPANVLSGKKFYNADGYQEGTIAIKSSSDLTASGATVTVPSGYYATQTSKSVATATHSNPTASINSSTGLVTASHTQGTGYVTGGTTTGTLQLTTQAAKTVTPSTSSQTAVAAGRYTTGAVTVAAMPSGTAGTPTATKGTVSNNSVSVTPSVTNTTGYITGSTKTGTAVTVSASELVSGTKSISENGTGIDVTNYASVDVSVSGGGGSTYSLTNIVPAQTVATTTSNLYGYVGLIPTYTEYVQSGSWYLVTYDNTEYVVTGYYGANSEILVGDYQLITSNVEWLETPFIVEYNLTNGYFFLGSRVSGNHTLKVDKIEFIDDGVTLVNKTVTSNGTYNASSDGADGYSSVTVNVSGGGGSVEPKDVNFIDYDGTILYSYTTAEALALDALPSNPSHSGLTAQGWNYTLAQIKTECNDTGKCTIGQMYITDSGDTEIDVKFVDPSLLSPYLSLYLTGTASIDWGDNSPTDAINGNGSYQHIYTAVGEYTIRIHVSSGTLTLKATDTKPILNRQASVNLANVAYSNCITAVRIGNNVAEIGSYCFYDCYSVKTITIPNTVTLIGNQAFRYCYSLIHITVPYNVTSIGSYAFDRCYGIQTVSLPSGLVSIDQYLFDYCNSLQFIAIPSSVQTIGNYAFQYCYSLRMVGIPSLLTSMGSYAFRGCSSLAAITIPSGITSLMSYLLNQNYSIASLNIPNGVTSIATYALNNMYALTELHVQPITPPTLAATSLTGIQTYCVIYVPQGSLEAYQAATNWSTYASYMQEES